MLAIKPILLTGTSVQLEPLTESHRNDLCLAAQNEQIWTYQPVNALGDNFNIWFDKALQGMQIGEQLPFIVRRIIDNQIIGSTRFYSISPKDYRFTIGYTWYIPEVWGSLVNPESKYLLLQHAFENLHVNRVEFNIDSRNARSRAAVKKLGAMEEGILRQHMVLPNGYVRDTVMFSIVSSEWADVKRNLLHRLAMNNISL